MKRPDIKKIINKYLKNSKKKDINLTSKQEEKLKSFVNAEIKLISQHTNGDIVIEVTVDYDKTASGKLRFTNIITKRGKVKH